MRLKSVQGPVTLSISDGDASPAPGADQPGPQSRILHHSAAAACRSGLPSSTTNVNLVHSSREPCPATLSCHQHHLIAMAADPKYTVFIRVPIPRGDFVDPPPVSRLSPGALSASFADGSG